MRYCMSASHPTLLKYGLTCFAQDQWSQVLKGALSVQLSAWVTVKFLCFSATDPSGTGTPHSLDFYTTHNDAPLSAELLWTSDQLVAETST
jgi:hypothetical protein